MGTKNVLIVDDAIDLGRLLSEALKTANPGIPVRVVPSAEEAILESTRLTIDLLITDIRLPGMTGLDLVRKIRARQPNVKVLVITGLTVDAPLQKQVDELKADAFMHKPMSMPEFLDTTSMLLGVDLLDNKPLTDSNKPAAARLTVSPDTVENQMIREVIAQALPGVSASELVVSTHPADKTAGVEVSASSEGGLSVRISGIRASLGAKAVILFDDRGRMVVQAGDLPDPGLMDVWLPPIISSLSAGAKLSYLLGDHTSRSVQAYRGKDYDLIYAPVGQYALLVMLISGKSNLRLALTFEEIYNVQGDLVNILEDMGLHIQSAVELGAPEKMILAGQPAAVDEEEARLESLIEKSALNEEGLQAFEEMLSTQETRLEIDADAFWETAGDEEKLDLNTPGVLSYEQAQKLGLLPGQEEG